jgi:hypothetical protein
MEKNDKVFIKESRLKLQDEIIDYLSDNEDDDLKFNQLKTYFMFLISNVEISNNNKVIYSHIFFETFADYIKNWFVDFLSNSILKIHKQDIKKELITNNQYFVFKFLANKEIIKNLLSKYLKLVDYYISISMKKIYFLEEAKTSFSEKNDVFDYMLKVLENDLDKSTITSIKKNNINIINYFFIFKKKIVDNQENFIELLNDKNIFEKNDNNEIMIADFFIDFAELYFSLKINKVNLFLDLKTEDEIKKELSENISFKTGF